MKSNLLRLDVVDHAVLGQVVLILQRNRLHDLHLFMVRLRVHRLVHHLLQLLLGHRAVQRVLVRQQHIYLVLRVAATAEHQAEVATCPA